MLRDPSLVPLSHQHHDALVLCVEIRRGLANPARDKILALARRTANFGAVQLENHFGVEESILFPAIREKLGPLPLIEELVEDHRRMKSLATRAARAEQGEQAEILRQFAELLDAHIRREEGELFEDIQIRLPAETLQQLGRAIKAEVARACV